MRPVRPRPRWRGRTRRSSWFLLVTAPPDPMTLRLAGARSSGHGLAPLAHRRSTLLTSAIIGRVPIEAVTFDFWNTLMYEEAGLLRGRRLAAWLGILEDAGFAFERQQLEAAFDRGWDGYVAAWKSNRQYHAAEAAESIIEALGFEPPPAVRAELLTTFREAGNEAEIKPTPNIGTCLATLDDAGVRIGIVCDVGMTPAPALREH